MEAIDQLRGERGRACRVRVFVWHGALSGSQQEKAERPMLIGWIEKNFAICEPKFCCQILCVSDELPVRFRGVSRHAELVLFPFSAKSLKVSELKLASGVYEFLKPNSLSSTLPAD